MRRVIELLLALLFIALIFQSACLARKPLLHANYRWQGASRAITFRTEQSIGTLRPMNMRSSQHSAIEGASLGPAVGTVEVPKDGWVALFVSYYGSVTMQVLDSLKPDDLQGLEFELSGVTDDSLQHIEHLTGLKRLFFRHCSITDKGLSHVRNLKQLNSLVFSRAHITDEGLKYLSGLTSLTNLELPHNKLDGSGLRYLNGLKNLNFLDLGNTGVTATDLTYVEHLPIDTLVASPKMTDKDCLILRRFKLLKSLSVNDCPITDAGLRILGRLPRLRQLYMLGTRITAKGVAEFERRHPQCHVTYIGAKPDFRKQFMKELGLPEPGTPE